VRSILGDYESVRKLSNEKCTTITLREIIVVESTYAAHTDKNPNSYAVSVRVAYIPSQKLSRVCLDGSRGKSPESDLVSHLSRQKTPKDQRN